MGEKGKSICLPEDIILHEILARVPIKPVFRFKCVSKRYNSIIPDPDLGKMYMQRAHSCPESLASSGLASALLYPFTNLPPNQNPSDSTIFFAGIKFGFSSTKLSSVSLPSDEIHKIVGSSNGLILSLFHPDHKINNSPIRRRFSLCVSNPLTKQSIQLPEPPSTQLIDYHKWVFGIAAKPLSTYKIVLIRRGHKKSVVDGHAKTSAVIFSSDTWSWATWEVSCPTDVFAGRRSSFSYKAILHFVGPMGRSDVITYDPFNSPDRLGGLPFPSSQPFHIKRSPSHDRVTWCKGAKSVIYSGEEEMLRFWEMRQKKGCIWATVRMWRLVDYDKGEWCYEREVKIRPPSPICCNRLMVAPNHCNRHVICHPFVRHNNLVAFQDQSLTSKVKKIVLVTPGGFRGPSSKNPLIPIEFCPWASPSFYALPSSLPS